MPLTRNITVLQYVINWAGSASLFYEPKISDFNINKNTKSYVPNSYQQLHLEVWSVYGLGDIHGVWQFTIRSSFLVVYEFRLSPCRYILLDDINDETAEVEKVN